MLTCGLLQKVGMLMIWPLKLTIITVFGLTGVLRVETLADVTVAGAGVYVPAPDLALQASYLGCGGRVWGCST